MKTIENTLAWREDFADPFVLRVDTSGGPEFYAYATGGTADDARPFPVLFSHDLKSWRARGGALMAPPLPDVHDWWAPEVAQIGDGFVMFYTVRFGAGGHHLRVAVSAQPGGPLQARGERLLPGENFSNDAHPFRDPRDGRWYLFFAKDYFGTRPGTGLAVVPLKGDGLTAAGDVVPVLSAHSDWQLCTLNSNAYNGHWPQWYCLEGPFCVFRHNRYFLFYSGGNYANDSYGISYAVADHPLGPWNDAHSSQGAMVLSSGASGLIGPGHNSVVVGPDERDYLVFHAWNAQRTRRQMHLALLEWTDDGPRLAL